jgi:hypothetical protein
MTRTTAIARYFQEGSNVCPFAKTCPLELAAVSANPRADRAALLRTVAAFAAARGNAIVLVARVDKGFAATATWAAETFLELMLCCLQIDHPTLPIVEAEQHVEQVIRPALSSSVIRPHLTLHGAALMTICMSPLYPTTHPRHAPQTILVTTWSADVSAAGSISKVREAMAREHGTVYDANELMLPLPTAPTRKLKMWVGNLDGSREGLVIASTKDQARKVVGTSRNDFNDHWRERPIDLALDPEVLYTRMFTISGNTGRETWYRGRCPLIREERGRGTKS